MHPVAKILIGFILLVIGLGLFVDSSDAIVLSGVSGTLGINWLGNFVIVLTGVIPIFLILIGLFVIWLEMDELKTEKELNKEECEEPKPKRSAKKK
jgi:cadmium resistance protein CadD (predicted permease)